MESEELRKKIEIYLTDEERHDLDLLSSINGHEQGFIDFCGCFFSGNYSYSYDDALDFVAEELGIK